MDNERKDPASRQPGINSFFFKSQQTEENGGADKAACPRVQENAFSGWGREGGCMPLDLPLGPFVTCHSAMF